MINKYSYGKKGNPLLSVLLIYLLCFLARGLEYFVLRTDQTVLGEAFVHKLLGIAILFAALKIYGWKFRDVGFAEHKVVLGIGKGLAFGCAVFAFAYLIESMILAMQGSSITLELYVSAYAIDGNRGDQTSFLFFAVCIAGNIINVIMEEGIFRGVFPKLLANKYGVIAAAIVASCLFGIWHSIAPIRSCFEGTMNVSQCIANIVMLVVTSGLVGFKFAMVTQLTGNLYMAMGDHFVNNTIVNILHVLSTTGADELMTVRIAIAQSTSFILILIWYVMKRKKAGFQKIGAI